MRRHIVLALAAALAVSGLWAPLPAHGNDYKPKLIFSPKLSYPRRALDRQMTGVVELEFAINSKGQTVDVQVISSSNTVFDKSAMKTAERWVFSPPPAGIVDVVRFKRRITFALQ
ncbi:MAG: energy transducer TonB [Pseudomonadota bacterium]